MPAVFAPGTSDVIVLVATLPQGAGAAEYVFEAADVDGAVGDWVAVFSFPLCSAVGVAASGPDDSAQPAAASTTTGDRRAVRVSGRGRDCTTHFSWGEGAEVRTAGGVRQCHMSPCATKGRTRSVHVR